MLPWKNEIAVMGMPKPVKYAQRSSIYCTRSDKLHPVATHRCLDKEGSLSGRE